MFSEVTAENESQIYLAVMSGFHQPQIETKLFKIGVKRDRVKESDPPLSKDGSFYCLVYTEFIPHANVKCTCQEKEVTLQRPKIVMRDKLLGPFLSHVN
nr:PREDICTED: beta-2-microglobulin-like [Equus przewalskii]